MKNTQDTSDEESDRFKLVKATRPPYGPDEFRSQFERELNAADNGALSEELRADIQGNLDALSRELEVYWRFWNWTNALITIQQNAFDEVRQDRILEKIEDNGMTKGMQSIGEGRHLTLPQPPVHELRAMEQLTLLVLDITDEPKSVGEIADDMATLLRETLEEYLQNKSDDSEPWFVEHARQHLDEEEIDQMEASLQDKLKSRVQYNLGSLDEKQYITRGPDPADKRRTIIELTATGELWVETHALSDPDADPVDSVLDDEVAAYVGVEKE